MTNDDVKQEIARIEAKVRVQSVKSREERQEFWTETMDDETVNRRDRLRASELLGKSEADFITVTRDETESALTLTPEQAQAYRDGAAIANRARIKSV